MYFRILTFYFVLGFIVFPVLGWKSEYYKNCKAGRETARQYLRDTYQIDGGSRMLVYKSLCPDGGIVEGTFSPAMKYLLGKDKEERKQLLKWLRQWEEHELLYRCEEILDILSCDERKPMGEHVIEFFAYAFVLLWLVLVSIAAISLERGREFWGLNFIIGTLFFSGLGLGWYVADWLYR